MKYENMTFDGDVRMKPSPEELDHLRKLLAEHEGRDAEAAPAQKTAPATDTPEYKRAAHGA